MSTNNTRDNIFVFRCFTSFQKTLLISEPSITWIHRYSEFNGESACTPMKIFQTTDFVPPSVICFTKQYFQESLLGKMNNLVEHLCFIYQSGCIRIMKTSRTSYLNLRICRIQLNSFVGFFFQRSSLLFDIV